MEVNGEIVAPAVLSLLKETLLSADKSLDGPQSQSGRGGKEESPFSCWESSYEVAQQVTNI
jgi:hypothetical protein